MKPFKTAYKRVLFALVIFLSALFALSAVLCGCSGYTRRESSNSSTIPTTKGGEEGGEENGGTEEEYFTVTILCEDSIDFTRNIIYVRWTNETSYYEARVSSDGVATGSASMDGDFKVTLDGVPSGYLYNPNNYYADNDNKSIEIELMAVTALRDSSGANGPFNTITINTTGAFVYTFESSSQYYFTLTGLKGYYAFESWANVEENTINPILYIYSSNTNNLGSVNATVNDGAESGTFTKNFYYELNMNAGEGSTGKYLFAISVDISTNISYPVDLYFTITYLGETVSLDDYELIIPDFGYTVTTVNGKYQNDNDGYKALKTLTEEDEEDNKGKDYYSMGHFYRNENTGEVEYDASAYYLHSKLVSYDKEHDAYRLYNSQTGEFGEYIYTYINNSTGEAAVDFNALDTEAGKSTHLNSKDYKLFLQGYERFASERAENYTASELAMYSDCKSYWDLQNSDGLCIVTQELYEYLDEWTRGKAFFKDGDGSYENANDNMSIVWSADDAAIWLLACCVYWSV